MKPLKIKCAKCGRQLLSNGLCVNCNTPQDALERLRALQKKPAPPRKHYFNGKPSGGAWFMNRLREKDAAERPLSGQDAAMPPGDRE